MTINLKSLIGKLDTPTRKAMESAANVALSRTHHEVDIEHVLLELLAASDGDLLRLLKAYHVDAQRLQADLLDSLDHFRTGNTRNPVLSRNILRWLESAWLAASVNDGAERLGSGYLLLALVTDEELQRLLTSSCAALKKLPGDDLRDQLPAILRQAGHRSGGKGTKKATGVVGQGEDASEGEYENGEDGGQPIGHLHGKNTPNLDKYTIDLTALARAGKIDPVLGRDGEIRQMIDILLRRRQNNPILTGEPGVGKTAVVEGLALRIIEGDIPEVLANITLRTLDLGLLQAGASVKGEFENRLRSVIDEVKASLKPIILFIDEAHTLIGAGGSAGQNDAANLLKPALARGELRTIAATTWSEYKKYFEKDAALARRFQVVKIDEPSEEAAIQMLRGIANAMEAHHKIRILDEAVEEAVKLSSRYITGRQLPDKAISVLDTACARVGLSQASKPAAVEDVERLIQNIDREATALKKEQDPAHDKRLTDLAIRRNDLEKDLATHQAAFVEQRQLVEEIIALRKELAEMPVAENKPAKKTKGAAKPAASGEAALRTKLLATEHKLHDLHKQQPLIYECVDSASIADVISGWTGIPLGGMIADEIDTVRNLHALLEQRVVGQTHALELIARRIQIAKANLEDPGKPKGVFLLVGPSGVGKTETALALADTLYGGERNLITINMSEYQEAHTVSGLKGSPPGYVGYGEGGVLTEAVRRKPHSVVLLDEVEKAHPDVLELFFQVFDKGLLEDAEGREVDFKNTIIILTSNVGTDLIMGAVEHGVTVEEVNRQPTPEDLVELLRPSLQRSFKPAFLGRLSVIPYYPISDEIMRLIVGLKLDKVKARLFINHGAVLKYDQGLVDLIVARCTEVDSGARDAEAIITNTVLTQISDQVLARMAAAQPVQSVDLKVRKDKLLVVVK